MKIKKSYKSQGCIDLLPWIMWNKNDREISFGWWCFSWYVNYTKINWQDLEERILFWVLKNVEMIGCIFFIIILLIIIFGIFFFGGKQHVQY